MIRLAYNPVTSEEINGPDMAGELSKVVTGIASSRLAVIKQDMNYVKNDISDYERSLKERQKKQEELIAEEKKFTDIAGGVDKVMKAIKKDIDKSDIFDRGLVHSINYQENCLYVITKELRFYAGTPIDGRTIKDDIDLGHYLIKIDPRYPDNMIKGISALDYTGDYSGPCIKNGSICWGSSETEYRRLSRKCDIVGLIDFVIGYIMSVNDEHGYISWDGYFRDRKAIKDYPVPGRPSAILQDGSQVLPIPRPLKLAEYKEVLKTVNFRSIRQIYDNSPVFYPLSHINYVYPKYYISKVSISEIAANPVQYGIKESGDKIDPKHIPALARRMRQIDREAGFDI